LIEVLVTLVVIGIGLLGLAALQLAGMRGSYSAFQRTQATLAASGLIERVLADPDSFHGVHYDTGRETGNSAFDDWRAELARLGLTPPSDGRPPGELDCAGANDCGAGHCAVSVRWNDGRAQAADTASSGGGDTAFLICTRLPD
jgi:type IV pilus assembly protein PilV